MKLKHVITIVSLLLIFGMAANFSIDSDTWWHLRAGQWMVDNQQAIRSDHFSYTRAETPWQYPGVWIQILMVAIFNSLGPGGLNLWVALMVAAIFSVVAVSVKGDALLRAGLLFVAAVSSATYWAARPYLFTYLFFAISFLLLEVFSRSNKKVLWLLPPIMFIWTNSHGGFIAGFILISVYLAESFGKWIIDRKSYPEARNKLWLRARNLFFAALGMFAATLLNPHGWKVWVLPFSTVSRQAEQLFIAEWQSPNFHDPWMLFFAAMLVVTILVLGASGSRASLKNLLLLAGFGTLGLVAVRNIFFFAIVWPAAIYPDLEKAGAALRKRAGINSRLDLSVNPTRAGKVINWVLVIVVGLLVTFKAVTVFPEEVNRTVLAEQFPIEAVDYLQKTQPDGNIFNSYNFGGYMTWAIPAYPVYVDGRADLFQDEIVLTWYRIINGSDEWMVEFEKWDIQTVLIEPGMSLMEILQLNEWEIAYQDEVAVILVAPR